MLGNWAKKIGFAVSGVLHAARTQASMRVHLLSASAVMGMTGFLEVSRIEWSILVLTIGVVIAAEIFNTSIESIVDLVSPDKSELARIAKDTAAGAVLVLAIAAAAIGLIILGPPLLMELRQLGTSR